METEEVKKTIRTALVPERRRRQALQPVIAAFISGVSIFASIPGLIGVKHGFPVGFYSPGTAACTALNCPPSTPAHVRLDLLIVNFFLWYIIAGIVYTGYRRWNE